MRRSLTRTFSVPTAAVRAGNFAGFASICDPLTIPATGVCAPFANNQIPASRIDPIASAFLRNVPLPTSSARGPESRRRWRHSTRDARSVQRAYRPPADGCRPAVRSLQHLRRRASCSRSAPASLQEALVPGFGRSLTTKTRNLVASHTRVFGSSLLNEVRFGWMSVERRAAEPESRQRLCQPGRPARRDDRSSRCRLSADLDRRFVQHDGRPDDLHHARRTSTSSCTTTSRSIAAAHRLKFGAYYFHLQLRPEQPDNARGAFTYTGQFTGNAFADFLLGYPTSATSGIGRGDENGRTNWLHLYVQDDWQARSNLTRQRRPAL